MEEGPGGGREGERERAGERKWDGDGHEGILLY